MKYTELCALSFILSFEKKFGQRNREEFVDDDFHQFSMLAGHLMRVLELRTKPCGVLSWSIESKLHCRRHGCLRVLSPSLSDLSRAHPDALHISASGCTSENDEIRMNHS